MRYRRVFAIACSAGRATTLRADRPAYAPGDTAKSSITDGGSRDDATIALRLGGISGMRLDAQGNLQMAVAGGEVELIVPDDASAEAFGANLMNPRHRPASAKAGLDQGRRIAQGLKGFWR